MKEITKFRLKRYTLPEKTKPYAMYKDLTKREVGYLMCYFLGLREDVTLAFIYAMSHFTQFAGQGDVLRKKGGRYVYGHLVVSTSPQMVKCRHAAGSKRR
ncbi:unnamed protein product [Acanthoscelides obtectus]|uniref:Uncharacterized protein n=1 Tax=Acanthoscelides obtectus TaxID=200917 RepID=A0A9P0JNH2_ACAOB|nr:unnamed protein product [Acanthoscelides obtectus]CAK1672346.1 hypothetical protein AOBTE_LOCUS28810 [Acanthoscelides obtectus]